MALEARVQVDAGVGVWHLKPEVQVDAGRRRVALEARVQVDAVVGVWHLKPEFR